MQLQRWAYFKEASLANASARVPDAALLPQVRLCGKVEQSAVVQGWIAVTVRGGSQSVLRLFITGKPLFEREHDEGRG